MTKNSTREGIKTEMYTAVWSQPGRARNSLQEARRVGLEQEASDRRTKNKISLEITGCCLEDVGEIYET